MPELPEVENIKLSLNNLLIGSEICALERLTPYCLNDENNYLSLENIRSKRYIIAGFRRHGKFLLCYLKAMTPTANKELTADNYSVLLFHMRMTGKLVYAADEQAWPKHTHFVFKLAMPAVKEDAQSEAARADNNTAYLYFNDVRRFGGVKVMPLSSLAQDKSLLNLGMDALTLEKGLKAQLQDSAATTKVLLNFAGEQPDKLSYEEAENTFVALFGKQKQRNIKACLLDQSLLAGLGNIYVDELLFAAKIHPDSIPAHLSDKQLRALFAEITPLLTKSVQLGGTSFSDYVDGLGRKGKFLHELKVFKREEQACLLCNTKISKIKTAGRGTHLCSKCQITY